MLLLTAALAPAAPVEGLIVAAGCAVLALATDRIRPWPRALAVPAAGRVLAARRRPGARLRPRPAIAAGPEPRARLALLRCGQRARDRARRGRPARARRRACDRADRARGVGLRGRVAACSRCDGVGPAGRGRRRGADGRRRRHGRGARRGGDIAWRTRIAILLVAPVAGLRRSRCSTSPPAATRTSAARCWMRAAWTRSRTSPSAACGSATARSGAVRSRFLVAFALIALAVGFRYAAQAAGSTEGAPGLRAAVYGLRRGAGGRADQRLRTDHPADRQQLPGIRRGVPGRSARSGPHEPLRQRSSDLVPPTPIDSIARMRIALVSPYSWKFPGGVTRHIDALAAEFLARRSRRTGLGPVDPDDRLTRAFHRRCARAGPLPDYLDARWAARSRCRRTARCRDLGYNPDSVIRLRRELRAGGFDVVHVHEPIAPVVGWDACSFDAGRPWSGPSTPIRRSGSRTRSPRCDRRTPHVQPASRASIAVSEAARWTGERYFGGTLRRDSQRRGHRPLRRAGPKPPDDKLRVLFVGRDEERKGLPVLLSAFAGLREHVPVRSSWSAPRGGRGRAAARRV